MLSVRDLKVGYSGIEVVHGINLDVAEGECVALIGANGAGKSTLLKTISGVLRPTAGRIVFDGAEISGLAPHRIVDAGLMHVAEGRRLFRSQSVRDNLELGLYGGRLDAAAEARRYEFVYELFPMLRERPDHRAGVLSGGQQQMLAIAQALMREPRLLMLDEPSLGLAPVIVDQVIGAIERLRAEGVTILLVEQMVDRALDIADRAYVFQNGVVIGHAAPADIRGGDLIRRAYLGAAG